MHSEKQKAIQEAVAAERARERAQAAGHPAGLPAPGQPVAEASIDVPKVLSIVDLIAQLARLGEMIVGLARDLSVKNDQVLQKLEALQAEPGGPESLGLESATPAAPPAATPAKKKRAPARKKRAKKAS